MPLLFLFFFSFLFNFLFNYLFFRLVSSFFSSFSCLFSSSFFLLLFFFLLFLLFAFFFFRFVSNTAKISQSLIFSYLAIKDKKLLLLLLQENSLRVFWSSIIVAYLSLLIVLFHAINFLGLHGPTLALSFTLTAFCCFFARCFIFVLLDTDLRQRFLPLGILYLAFLPHIWCMHLHNLL